MVCFYMTSHRLYDASTLQSTKPMKGKQKGLGNLLHTENSKEATTALILAPNHAYGTAKRRCLSSVSTIMQYVIFTVYLTFAA